LGLIARAQSEPEYYQPWATGMRFELENLGEEITNKAYTKFNIRTTIDSNMNLSQRDWQNMAGLWTWLRRDSIILQISEKAEKISRP
jgi:hypothetical protein